jgi:hypothetical protein
MISNQELLRRELRANPRYELVLFDRLAPAEQEALAALRQQGDLFGLLKPSPGSSLRARSVDHDTALLFFALLQPGTLPAYVLETHGEAAFAEIKRLVADTVLEVRSGEGFVTGPAALEGLRTDTAQAPQPGRLAELSRQALRHAQLFSTDDPGVIALRLYQYNRRPLTPEWRRRLASPAAVEHFLGVGVRGPHRSPLHRHWAPSPPTFGWCGWSTRSRARNRPAGRGYKLYVSPQTESLPDCFGRLLEALSTSGAHYFKVGSDPGGLLRSDKIVAYFSNFEELAAAAGAVGEALSGVVPQGVPFSAEIAGDGLVSWGIDPPAGESSAIGAGRESWRLWIANQLANALLTARATSVVEPWRFALDRLALAGIDVATWAPASRLWRAP